MKRFLLAAMMIFAMTGPVFAGGLSTDQLDRAGWNKLSEEEKAKMIQGVAKAAEQKSGIGSAEKVEKWVDIGERIGKMIGGAAREVGVAVNDFVKTPVGKMAMVIIVWHYMGNVLLHFFGGVVVLVVGLGFIFYMLRRVRVVEYQYSPDKTDIFGRSRLVKVHRDAIHDAYVTGYTMAAGVVLIASIVTMFSY